MKSAMGLLCVLFGLLGFATSVTSNSDIKYTLGSPVMTGTTKLYIIYYGDWSEAAMNLTNYFATGLGSTEWWKISQKYYYQANATSEKVYVSVPVFAESVVDAKYSLGKQLTDADVQKIIIDNLESNLLTYDPHGIYIVDVAPDVSVTVANDILLRSFGGYHSTFEFGDGNNGTFCIPYILIGDASAVPESQIPRMSSNGMPGIEVSLNVLAHEITEAITDPIPQLGGWRDAQGEENADKCSWIFGTETFSADGSSSYNMVMGDKKFLIQQNWDPEYQMCTSTYIPPPACGGSCPSGQVCFNSALPGQIPYTSCKPECPSGKAMITADQAATCNKWRFNSHFPQMTGLKPSDAGSCEYACVIRTYCTGGFSCRMH